MPDDERCRSIAQTPQELAANSAGIHTIVTPSTVLWWGLNRYRSSLTATTGRRGRGVTHIMESTPCANQRLATTEAPRVSDRFSHLEQLGQHGRGVQNRSDCLIWHNADSLAANSSRDNAPFTSAEFERTLCNRHPSTVGSPEVLSAEPRAQIRQLPEDFTPLTNVPLGSWS